jgi:hypothetical protein
MDKGKRAILVGGPVLILALCLWGHVSEPHPKILRTAENLDRGLEVPGRAICRTVLAHDGHFCIGAGTYCGGNPFDLLGERPVIRTKVTIESRCVIISPPETP